MRAQRWHPEDHPTARVKGPVSLLLMHIDTIVNPVSLSSCACMMGNHATEPDTGQALAHAHPG